MCKATDLALAHCLYAGPSSLKKRKLLRAAGSTSRAQYIGTHVPLTRASFFWYRSPHKAVLCVVFSLAGSFQQAFVRGQWQTPLGQSAHHDLLPTCTSPAAAYPSSHTQGPFAAPGLSLLWNSSGTSKCREVLASEKSLNTNIKAFEINYPFHHSPSKTNEQSNNPHHLCKKNPSASVSPQKIILGKVLPRKALIPKRKHDATITDVCLPVHTHRTICKHQMRVRSPARGTQEV